MLRQATNGECHLMSRMKFLDHYKNFVIRELLHLKGSERGSLAMLARKIEMDPSRLSELIGGRRNLTSDYLLKMIGGGFFTVDQLLKGRGNGEVSHEEREFIASLKVVEDRDWINIITNLKKDPEREKMAKEMIRTLIK